MLFRSLKDPGQRQELLGNAQKNFMSVAEIKRQVMQLNQSTPIDSGTPGRLKLSNQQFSDRLTVTLKAASQNLTLWEDPQRIQKLEKLLKQLETIVHSGIK